MLNSENRKVLYESLDKFLGNKNNHAEKLLSIEDDILALNDAGLSIHFVENVPKANIKSHLEVVINSNEPYNISYFRSMLTIMGCNELQTDLEKAMLATGNEDLIRELCSSFDGAINNSLRQKARDWLLENASKACLMYYLLIETEQDGNIIFIKRILEKLYPTITYEERNLLNHKYPDFMKRIERNYQETVELEKLTQLIRKFQTND